MYRIIPTTLCLIMIVHSQNTLAGRAKPKRHYSITWTEQGGRIKLASICASYARSSIDYRQCRSYALDHFQGRCRKERRREQRSSAASVSKVRKARRKFCAAARRLP